MAHTLFSFATFCALGSYVVLSVTVGSTGDVTTTVPKSLWSSWAMYSPYFAVGQYEGAPKNCRVTQVNILQRHGARYPTASAGKKIVAAITKLTSVSANFTDSSLDFLKTYTYTLGADNLNLFGAAQSLAAGRDHYQRYKYLLSPDQLPFVRASSSNRVVDSAGNWTLGINHVYNPPLSVILSEDGNDTLDDNMCPDAGSSDDQTNAWLAVYGAPIVTRLNTHAPGASLTGTDIYNIMSMCAFESAVLGHKSPFCNLFTQAEFEQFEYYGDLDKYYGTGYGQPLGPVQGVGYINELLARLTGKPVMDNTQTNHTLDSSSLTFPLNRTIYADFSHDDQMIAIYAALGLFKQATPLNPTSPDPKRNWLVSHLVPFSARMLTEKLTCTQTASGNGTGKDEKGKKETEREFVRIFVSDAKQPLGFCSAGKDGLCTVDAFVESQSYARNNGNGDFEKCFA